MDEDGFQQTQMGQMNQFGGFVQLVVDYTTRGFVARFLQIWEATKDGRIQGRVHGQEILIDQIFIHEQLGISKEGAVDVVNATFDEPKPL